MGMKMTIDCGTRKHEKFTIDLDDYGNRTNLNVAPCDEDAAFELLRVTMDDVSFADDGCRNEDAVNGCIALHVLGYDAEEWFENFRAEQRQHLERWFLTDLDTFMDHVERVAKYLYRWGPEGEEAKALGYSI